MPSGFIVGGVKDALAAALGILESAKQEVVWLVPRNCYTCVRGYLARYGLTNTAPHKKATAAYAASPEMAGYSEFCIGRTSIHEKHDNAL